MAWEPRGCNPPQLRRAVFFRTYRTNTHTDAMKIKFLRDYTVKPNGPTYKKGKVLECEQATADHFINRDAAEIVATATKAPKPKTPKTPAE